MKAVILAAGKGTRMLPLTNDIPKVLININEEPFFCHVLEKLKGFELGIVIGYKGDMIKKYVEACDINAEFIEQKELLGTGHAISQAEKFVGNEDFIVIMGDNLYSENDIKEVSSKQGSCVAGKESDHPEKYGVLVHEGEILKKIVEKPRELVGNLVNTGLYKFTPEIFNVLKQIKKSERGELEVTDAINILAKQGKVKVHKIKDYWIDFGKPEDIETVSKFLKQTKVEH